VQCPSIAFALGRLLEYTDDGADDYQNNYNDNSNNQYNNDDDDGGGGGDDYNATTGDDYAAGDDYNSTGDDAVVKYQDVWAQNNVDVDDDLFHREDNVGFDGRVSIMPVSCVNY
jgi:hypothetical protein